MKDVVATSLERMVNAMDDKNTIRGFNKICRNANFGIAALESDDIMTEASKMSFSINTMNKKLSMSSHSRTIDNVLVYIFLKSILTVPSQTDAYKMGLIDREGNLKRTPVTDKENAAISNLDLFMAKIRKWIKPNLSKMSSMSWVRSVGGSDRIQNALANSDMVSKRAYVIRVNKELDKILKQR